MSSSPRSRPKRGSNFWFGNVGFTTRRSRCAIAYSSAGFSPHHQVATDGSRSDSPSSTRAAPGRKPSQAADSSTPLPSALAITTRPARTAPSKPGTPSAESARSSSGSQKSSSSRRRIACTRRRPGQRLQEHAVVAHRQVLAVHQRQSELAREIGMLEVGFVERARGQYHHQRRAAVVRHAASGSGAAYGRTRSAAGCRARLTSPGSTRAMMARFSSA